VSTEIQTCYRHGDRRAGVRCQRCERPICPSCMVSASVGFHCPECAQSGRQKVLTARNLATRPIVTQVLVGMNALVFLAGLANSTNDVVAGNGGGYTIDGGLIASATTLNPATGVQQLIGVAHGEWYRIFTSGFLHAGLLHIGLNMYALWILGSQLEPALGRLRFASLYLVSLISGALGVMLLSPHELTVGASGAIFGLFGAALAFQRVQRIDIWASGLGGLLLVNLAFSFIPGISLGGHLGGLAGGFVCGYVYFGLGRTNKALPVLVTVALGALCFGGAMWAAYHAAPA
jgi:membrane associated rhomboid family serine protease